MLESYSYRMLQSKPNTVPAFEDALLLTWPTLPEKAIDNGVKDFRKQILTALFS